MGHTVPQDARHSSFVVGLRSMRYFRLIDARAPAILYFHQSVYKANTLTSSSISQTENEWNYQRQAASILMPHTVRRQNSFSLQILHALMGPSETLKYGSSSPSPSVLLSQTMFSLPKAVGGYQERKQKHDHGTSSPSILLCKVNGRCIVPGS